MYDFKVCREDITAAVRDSFIQEARHRHLMHQPPRQLPEWQQQCAQLLQTIRRHAGSVPPPPALDVQVHAVKQMDGYEVRNVTYQSRPGMRVTANLYVPEGTGPFPAVLGMHGHWTQGKIAERVQDRGHVLAKNGFVVLTVDAFGAGERGTTPGQYEYHGGELGAMLFNLGESLLGMQVYDNMRGVDLLTELDCVDADRIGATGASGGGNQTMWLAALDPRIKAAVPVVSVGTFESYITRSNCVCEVLPDGLTFMEEWAALAMVAPNALLILNALRDGNPSFAVPEMIRSFNHAREIYKLYDRSDRIAYQAIDLTHGYWPEMQEHMLGWFRRWLKDEGEGRPCPLPAFSTLPETDCLCFPDGKRPATVPSIREYYTIQSRRLCDEHLQDKTPVRRARKVAELRAVLRMPGELAVTGVVDAGQDQQAGLTVRKELAFTGTCRPLPIVTLATGKRRPELITLVVHPRGKRHFEKDAGLKKLVTAKSAVVLADLSVTGETCYDQSAGQPLSNYHNHSRTLFWLGRTMLGEWAADMLALTQWLRQRADGVEVWAYQEAGLAALAAAAAGAEWRKLRIEDMIGTYASATCRICESMAVHVPGILPWGDVSMLAAAAACPVEIVNPVDAEGKLYDAEQCRRLGEEIKILTARWDEPGPGVKVLC